MIEKLKIVFIGVSGWFAGITLAHVNEWLQFLVLIVTLIGLVWRSFNRVKKV